MTETTTVYFGKARTPPADRRRAAGLFVRLFAASPDKNVATAGAALLRRDGSCAVVTGRGTPAAFAAKSDFRELYAAVDGDAVALLGYASGTPAATPRPQAITQPVKMGSTVAVYDGGVANARALAADLGLARDGDADIIVRLVNMAWTKCRGDDAAAVASTRLRLLNGTFSFAAWDRRFPESLLVGRYRRDLESYRDGAYGPTYFSSRRGLLAKVFGTGGAGLFPDNEIWLCGRERAALRRAKIFPRALRREYAQSPNGPATDARR